MRVLNCEGIEYESKEGNTFMGLRLTDCGDDTEQIVDGEVEAKQIKATDNWSRRWEWDLSKYELMWNKWESRVLSLIIGAPWCNPVQGPKIFEAGHRFTHPSHACASSHPYLLHTRQVRNAVFHNMKACPFLLQGALVSLCLFSSW